MIQGRGLTPTPNKEHSTYQPPNSGKASKQITKVNIQNI